VTPIAVNFGTIRISEKGDDDYEGSVGFEEEAIIV